MPTLLTLKLAYISLFALSEAVVLCAKVAKLVDALDLGSSGATCESSSLSFRTRQFFKNPAS
jgi:hypothetical protein